ncbi:hypothetical protein B484DRAFT_468624 [Ochromonadaceae sp. CCMP2298]|nr:hypothetical protein B484DRAFT_468624 [Ochromonadaceae sp. CCMP2298]
MISLGDTNKKCESHGRGTHGPLTEVMWAPSMSYSLVSVSQLDRSGHVSVFGGRECVVLHPSVAERLLAEVADIGEDAVVMHGDLRHDRLYHVQGDLGAEPALAATEVTAQRAVAKAPKSNAAPPVMPYTFAANRAEILGSKGTTRAGAQGGLNPLQILHLRTGHASKVTLLAAQKANALKGAQTTYEACRKLEIGLCEACVMSKMRADSVPVSHRDYGLFKPIEEIGLDPVPLSTPTIDGNTSVTMGICYKAKLVFGYEAQTDGQQTVTMRKITRDWCVPFKHEIKVVHSDSAKYLVDSTAF